MNQLAKTGSGGANALADLQMKIDTLGMIKSIMREGIHYGPIPGAGERKILFKDGALMILRALGLVTGKAEITKDEQENFASYEVSVPVQTMDGQLLCYGEGEANTGEEKYMWVQAKCEDEFNEAAAENRRVAYKRGGRGIYTVQQVRANSYSIRNTVMKMAKKRAIVDATLAVIGGLGEQMFTQDLEDLPADVRRTLTEDDLPSADEYTKSVKSDTKTDKPPAEKPAEKKTTHPRKEADPEQARKLFELIGEYCDYEADRMEEICGEVTEWRGNKLAIKDLDGAKAGRLYHAIERMKKKVEAEGEPFTPPLPEERGDEG